MVNMQSQTTWRSFLKAVAAIAALLRVSTSPIAADDDAEARFRGTGKADPIRIESVRRADGPAAGQSSITFDLAWDHSWRTAWKVGAEQHGGAGTLNLENWDAAWVFVKFRKPGDDGWSHATLSTDASAHSVPAGAALDVGPSDDGERGVGVFVSRSAPGSGPNDWKGATLRWLHEADGVEVPRVVEFKVLAVQMVYVPQGAFWLGDGSTTVVAGQFSAGDSADPYRVESEDAITLGGQSRNNLLNRDGIGMYLWPDDFTSGGTKPLPARFPKGYAAFYCMKYHIIANQYAEFLNALDEEQANQRYPGTRSRGLLNRSPEKGYYGKPGGARQGPGCFGLSWADGAAFAAWAGLRPMTELECEKVVRGTREPIPGEVGPSYWGVSGLDSWRWNAMKGDQQCERPVTVGNAEGRRFQGTHGCGTPTLPADWPQEDAVGTGIRGGHGAAGHPSNRLNAAVADFQRRPHSFCWRGVRTAPEGVGL